MCGLQLCPSDKRHFIGILLCIILRYIFIVFDFTVYCTILVFLFYYYLHLYCLLNKSKNISENINVTKKSGPRYIVFYICIFNEIEIREHTWVGRARVRRVDRQRHRAPKKFVGNPPCSHPLRLSARARECLLILYREFK